MVPRPAVSASSGNLLEMKIIWPHPEPTELETLGVRLRSLNKPFLPGKSDVCVSATTAALRTK